MVWTVVVLDAFCSLAKCAVIQKVIDVALIDVPGADAPVVPDFTIVDHGVDRPQYDIVTSRCKDFSISFGLNDAK